MRGAKRSKFLKYLRTHNLYVRQTGRSHLCIEDEDGRYIASASISPSCPYWMENVIKDLVKAGYLPEEEKRKRWR